MNNLKKPKMTNFYVEDLGINIHRNARLRVINIYQFILQIFYAAVIREINKPFIITMNMQSFSQVPDQVGYLLLHESGATISSSGELENDEKTAETIYNLISLTDKLDPLAFSSQGFNKISICYKDFCYIICMSNKKIHVVKRKMTVGLNQSTVTSVEPHLIDLQVPVNNSINT